MSSKVQETAKVNGQVAEVLKRIGDSGYPITDEIREKAKEVVDQMLLNNVSPMEVLHFSPYMIEKIYTHSFNLFRAGKYEEALPLFKLLHSLNPYDARYSFSVAACNHYLKNYMQAAGNYIECAGLDPVNPLPFFYLSDCFIHSGYPLSAYHAIQTSIALAKLDPQYATFQEKAQLEANALEVGMKEYLAKNFENKGG